MSKKVLIGGAWPYANGSLHIGHIAGLLPGDVLARYYRAAGDDVYYVLGSDCHGTPVCIRAKQEGKTPQQVSDAYHEEFTECFRKLGFSYDVYGKTSQPEHKEFVQKFHKKLYESEYVYEKEELQAYCETCHQFLPDRFVVGICPVCGSASRGDQCDVCGTVLDTIQLKEPTCSICHGTPVWKKTTHLYLSLTKLRPQLKSLVDTHPEWRKNAIAFTNRYLDEGLCDRALTRDLDWGIDVPKDGYEGKKIYIWAENVLGYLSMSKIAAKKRNTSFEELWGPDALHYYVHAKDNIPFHTIILPGMLIANQSGYHLPDRIISNEYLTLEGRKISTSQNWAVWVKDIADDYQADALRYFMIANGPEKRDTDFTWSEFARSCNGELAAAYGNFVNRTLAFANKYLNHTVPEGELSDEIAQRLDRRYEVTGKLIEAGQLKEAINQIFEEIRWANKYYDENAPWTTRTTDLAHCKDTIYQCIQLTANFAVLLQPFLPFSSKMLFEWLSLSDSWERKNVASGYVIPEVRILFERIELPKEKDAKLKS